MNLFSKVALCFEAEINLFLLLPLTPAQVPCPAPSVILVILWANCALPEGMSLAGQVSCRSSSEPWFSSVGAVRREFPHSVEK